MSLVPRPDQGNFEAWDANLLPFYAGEIEYETEFELGAVPPGDQVLAEIGLPAVFQDAVEVAVNGGEWVAAPWPPYEVVLRTADLRCGTNRLRLRVLTSLIRAFEGEAFDGPAHTSRRVGESRHTRQGKRRTA